MCDLALTDLIALCCAVLCCAVAVAVAVGGGRRCIHHHTLSTLTVREHLLFQAKLRLPSSTSEKEREERVEAVINELGLDKV